MLVPSRVKTKQLRLEDACITTCLSPSFKICNLSRIELWVQIVYLGFMLVTVTSFLPCQDFTPSLALWMWQDA